MKKLLLIGLFILTFNAFSQNKDFTNWPAPDAKWRYCLTGSIPSGYLDFSVISDTIINDKSYHIIRPFQGSDNNYSPQLASLKSLFVRTENDTIFRFVNSKEYLFFTFNARLGDVINTFRSSGAYNWNDSACVSALPLKVTDISTVTYNGEQLRKWTLVDTLSKDIYATAHTDFEYVFVEKIGIVNTYPFINVWESSYNLLTDTQTCDLASYSGNNFSYTFIEECAGVGLVQFDTEKPSVYYNSFNHSLNVSFSKYCKENTKIHLHDIGGRILLQETLYGNPFELSLPKLENGVYIVKLQRNSSFYSTKVVIVK